MPVTETRWPWVDAGCCRLRPACADDLPALQAAVTDPRFPQHLPLARMSREGGLGGWLAGLLGGQSTTRLWTVTEQVQDACIGQVGLVPMQESAGHWVSYWLSPDWQGRGIASAALTGLVNAALARPAYRRLIAAISPDNGASIAVVLRAGFVAMPAHDIPDGVPAGFDIFERSCGVHREIA